MDAHSNWSLPRCLTLVPTVLTLTCGVAAGASTPMKLHVPSEQSNACALMPSGSREPGPSRSDPGDMGYADGCFATYGSALTGIFIWVFPDSAAATGTIDLHVRAGFQESPERLGDRTIMHPMLDRVLRHRGIMFLVGCYVVKAEFNDESEGEIRGLLPGLASRIKNEPPCPGGTAGPGPPVSGDMGLALACDSVGFGATGRLACSAAVSNVPRDGELFYRWTVDGNEQGVSGSDLTLDGLAPGRHTISVSAVHTSNNKELGPESASFIRGSGMGP